MIRTFNGKKGRKMAGKQMSPEEAAAAKAKLGEIANQLLNEPCPFCMGKGKTRDDKCKHCGGSGKKGTIRVHPTKK